MKFAGSLIGSKNAPHQTRLIELRLQPHRVADLSADPRQKIVRPEQPHRHPPSRREGRRILQRACAASVRPVFSSETITSIRAGCPLSGNSNS